LAEGVNHLILINIKNLNKMTTNQFKFALIVLEAYKQRTKEIHWNAISIHEHKLADEVYLALNEFQDNFAEEGFIIFDKFNSLEFKTGTTNTSSSDLKDLLEKLKGTLIDIRIKMLSDEYGLLAIVDFFIHDVNKFIYLAEMS
jgi:hypothetical protein